MSMRTSTQRSAPDLITTMLIDMYFNAGFLSNPRSEFVAWVDVMGVKSHMAWSPKTTANFIYKLHIACIQAKRDELRLYPVMDGLFVTSPNRSYLESFLKVVFRELASLFRRESQPHFRFIARGGIAYGLVYHGSEIDDDASPVLASNPTYRSSIVIGAPVVDAFSEECNAPPFGISVHESARESDEDGPPKFAEKRWQWVELATERAAIAAALRDHYEWCRQNQVLARYRLDAIDRHAQMSDEYFRA